MAKIRARQGLMTAAAVIVVLAGMKAAAVIIVPIGIAVFLAFVSSPVVFRLSKKIPYWAAVTTVLLVELIGLVGLGVLVGGSAARFQERLPIYRDRLGDVYAESALSLRGHGVPVAADRLTELLDPQDVLDLLGSTITGLGAVLSNLVLVLLVLAFTLFDAARLWSRIEQHFAGGPAGEHVLGTISREVNRYLAMKTSTSAATGLLLGTWCGVMGIDFAVLWGLLAFLLNFVPTVGSILAAIPPVLIALVMVDPGTALAVAGGYLTVNMIIGNMLEPRIFGTRLGMSPVVVLLSIVVWGWILGPVGALLSVPLTMILKIALGYTKDWSWIADLMSGPIRTAQPEKVPLSEEDAEA